MHFENFRTSFLLPVLFAALSFPPLLVAQENTEAGDGLPIDINTVQVVQEKEGSYVFTWGPVAPETSVQITGGSSPTRIDHGKALVKAVGGTTAVISGLDPSRRWYFDVAFSNGREIVVAPRHLNLQGAPNFRDLGGYTTSDGGRTRWGVFYRSGKLNGLTSSDQSYLKNSGLKLDCDLRSDTEVASEPDVKSSWSYQRQTITNSPSKKEIFSSGVTYDEAAMVKLYKRMIDSNAGVYAGAFEELARQGAGSVVHCSGGKDRTGIFSALLLMVANVPDGTIVNDYALTDQYLAPGLAANLSALKAKGQNPALLGALLYAPPSVMIKTLAYLREKYGSAEAYLKSGGLPEAELKKLRDDFVQ